MTAQQIKVSIADDHKIFRDGIKMALRDREYLKILLCIFVWTIEFASASPHPCQDSPTVHQELLCASRYLGAESVVSTSFTRMNL